MVCKLRGGAAPVRYQYTFCCLSYLPFLGVSALVMPLSENFQTKTKPIPTKCKFGKPNTKPILYGLQKADICTKFLKKLIFTHIKVFYKQKIS